MNKQEHPAYFSQLLVLLPNYRRFDHPQTLASHALSWYNEAKSGIEKVPYSRFTKPFHRRKQHITSLHFTLWYNTHNSSCPLLKDEEVIHYDNIIGFFPSPVGFYFRQPHLFPRHRQHRRPPYRRWVYPTVRGGTLDAASRRPPFRHPRRLQHHRLPRAAGAAGRLYDGRRPQRLPCL